MRETRTPNCLDIRGLLDRHTFDTAVQYQNENRVRDFRVLGGRMSASVRGSGFFVYRVDIAFDDDGEIRYWHCNCPVPGMCKHIGAVLLHAARTDTGGTLSDALNTVRTMTPPPDRLIPADSAPEHLANEFVAELSGCTVQSSPPPPVSGFRLTFLMERNDGYGTCTSKRTLWKIGPAAQYIKKNGAPGRLEPFVPKKISASLSHPEHTALQLFRKNFYRPEDAALHLGFFLEHTTVPLMIRTGPNAVPAQPAPIQATRLQFGLAGLEDEVPVFTPQVTFQTTQGDIVSGEMPHLDLIISASDLFFLGWGGTIAYRRGNPPYAAFVNGLLSVQARFTRADIRFLETYIATHLPDDISLQPPPDRLRITHRLPLPCVEVEKTVYGCWVSLFFEYGDRRFKTTHPAHMVILEQESEEIVANQRNRKYENLISDFIVAALFPVMDQNSVSHSRFYSRSDGYKLPVPLEEFLGAFGQTFLEQGIEIRLKGSRRKVSAQNGSVTLSITSGIDWFDVKAHYRDPQSGGNPRTVVPVDLDRGLVQIGDSWTILRPDDIEMLRRLVQEGMNAQGHLRVSRYNLALIDELGDAAGDNPQVTTVRSIARRLKNVTTIEKTPLSENFQGVLRPYQQAGYDWLNFLHTHELGGCLADDMGLGKTVQALAFLQALKDRGHLGTALLVVPVSTIPNWEHEIQRFAPSLTSTRHAGTSRARDVAALQPADLIIVSYQTLRNDVALFSDLALGCIVLDEAQNIKNAASKTFKTVRSLQARHRLSLTGTPVENNTLELWAQMEFLNPGLLGTLKNFRTRFARPIEAQSDSTAAERLRKTVFPFILRRRKDDVARDLPGREIITVYAEMGERQRAVYEQYRESCRESVATTLEKKGLKKSAVEIFEALLKLRQIALFPVLADSQHRTVESCKFDVLKDMLADILGEDHKVLLFSQFVQSLRLIEAHVQETNVPYVYLDGSTRKRDAVIRKFQENDDVRVFLLSLKAGGTGINLTAADYVVLFDPWWNPAVENQAIDRSHRIGQRKKVIAYKLIVRDTVEEKILHLQEKKKSLVSELIREDSGFFKSLSPDAVMDLFS